MKSISIFSLFAIAALLFSCNAKKISQSEKEEKMELSNREKAVALIESLETGAQEPAGYINPNKYIQHNLSVGDGLEGFGKVLANAPEGGFKAKVVRSFQDGAYAILHTEYDFFGPKVGFDVFRFEEGKIVEHWDNLSDITPPNPSGRTQLDGEVKIVDQDKTEENKALVKAFMEDVLMNGKTDKLTDYVNPTKYLQHNSGIADGLDGLGAALKYFAENGLVLQYDTIHKILGEGNFVLAMSEGKFGAGDHVGYYDLFRIEDGKIVEHWDVIQTIPPQSEWQNTNGKF